MSSLLGYGYLLLCKAHAAMVTIALADFTQSNADLSAWLEPGGSVVDISDFDHDGGAGGERRDTCRCGHCCVLKRVTKIR